MSAKIHQMEYPKGTKTPITAEKTRELLSLSRSQEQRLNKEGVLKPVYLGKRKKYYIWEEVLQEFKERA